MKERCRVLKNYTRGNTQGGEETPKEGRKRKNILKHVWSESVMLALLSPPSALYTAFKRNSWYQSAFVLRYGPRRDYHCRTIDNR